MSAFVQVLVDRSATLEEATEFGDAVLQWLRSNGVVADTPQTNAVLVARAKELGIPFEEDSGWPPGPRYEEWVDDADPTSTRETPMAWFTVNLGREVHAFPDGGEVECHCPAGHSADQDDAMAAVGDWYDGADATLDCDGCGRAYDIADWDLGPELAIGYLAFRFDDWGVLTDSLVAELRSILAPHATQLIVGKL